MTSSPQLIVSVAGLLSFDESSYDLSSLLSAAELIVRHAKLAKAMVRYCCALPSAAGVLSSLLLTELIMRQKAYRPRGRS